MIVSRQKELLAQILISAPNKPSFFDLLRSEPQQDLISSQMREKYTHNSDWGKYDSSKQDLNDILLNQFTDFC